MAKPQSKTEKKIDSNVRLALSTANEQLLKDIPGFQWLRHQANYTNFPASLLITCVFDKQPDEDFAHTNAIYKLLHAKLLKIGVRLQAPKLQVILDSEEACLEEDNGDWEVRLAGRKQRAVARNRPDEKRL